MLVGKGQYQAIGHELIFHHSLAAAIEIASAKPGRRVPGEGGFQAIGEIEDPVCVAFVELFRDISAAAAGIVIPSAAEFHERIQSGRHSVGACLGRSDVVGRVRDRENLDLAYPKFRTLRFTRAVTIAGRESQGVDLRKRRAEVERVIAPRRQAEITMRAGIDEIFAFAFDLFVDTFLDMVQRILAILFVELDLQIQVILVDTEVVLNQGANAEAIPTAVAWLDTFDSPGSCCPLFCGLY